MVTMLATLNVDTEKMLRDASPSDFWKVRITRDIVLLKEGKSTPKLTGPNSFPKIALPQGQSLTSPSRTVTSSDIAQMIA